MAQQIKDAIESECTLISGCNEDIPQNRLALQRGAEIASATYAPLLRQMFNALEEMEAEVMKSNMFAGLSASHPTPHFMTMAWLTLEHYRKHYKSDSPQPPSIADETKALIASQNML